MQFTYNTSKPLCMYYIRKGKKKKTVLKNESSAFFLTEEK